MQSNKRKHAPADGWKQYRQLWPDQWRTRWHDLDISRHSHRLCGCNSRHGRDGFHVSPPCQIFSAYLTPQGTNVWRPVPLGVGIRTSWYTENYGLPDWVVLCYGLANFDCERWLYLCDTGSSLARTQRPELRLGKLAWDPFDHFSRYHRDLVQHFPCPEAATHRRLHSHLTYLWLLCDSYSTLGSSTPTSSLDGVWTNPGQRRLGQ